MYLSLPFDLVMIIVMVTAQITQKATISIQANHDKYKYHTISFRLIITVKQIEYNDVVSLMLETLNSSEQKIIKTMI